MKQLTDYPVKVLVAFAETLEGKDNFYHWLFKNGYPELSALSSSIKGNEEAFDWLMKRKFPNMQHSAMPLMVMKKHGYG